MFPADGPRQFGQGLSGRGRNRLKLERRNESVITQNSMVVLGSGVELLPNRGWALGLHKASVLLAGILLRLTEHRQGPIKSQPRPRDPTQIRLMAGPRVVVY